MNGTLRESSSKANARAASVGSDVVLCRDYGRLPRPVFLSEQDELAASSH